MNHLYRISITLLVTLVFGNAHSQDFAEEYVKYKTPNVLPPSPTPASLGKFGNVPVNLYTGLANISIPVFDIKMQDFTLPVSLDYHSGGVRVEELAPSVGLEWSLMAGGAITRVIRGKADEDATNYGDEGSGTAAQVEKFVKNQMTQTARTNFMIAVANGYMDTEPDIFQVNVPGILNEKFIFCPGKGFIVIPNKKIKIEGDPMEGYVITTTDGRKFYFKEKESTQVISRGSKSGTGPFGYLDPVNYYSSWFLNKIDLNNGNVITLDYVASTIRPAYNGTFSHYVRQGASPMDCQGNPIFENEYYINTTNSTTIGQKKIRKITWPSGYLQFNYENTQRADLSGDSALKEIVVFNNTAVKRMGLSYNYYSNRLFLSKVTVQDATGSAVGAYDLAYSNPNLLPDRTSYAQDHWGFYNGANNSAYMENREPNGTLTLYGVIKRLTYPTGGYSEFEFEPNTYGNIEGTYDISDTIRATVDTSVNCYSTSDPSTVTTGLFYIPFKQSVYVTANVKGSNTSARIYTAAGTILFNLVGTNTTLKTVNQYVELDTGYYYLRTFNYETEFRADIAFSYKKYTGAYTVNRNRMAGGARVKKITDYDYITGNSIVREFNYDREGDIGKSSGILNNVPFYTYLQNVCRLVSCDGFPGGGTIISNVCAPYTVYQSQSALSIIYTNGSHIGYNTVTVSYGTQGSGGKSISHFTHYDQFPDFTFPGYPFTNSLSRDYKRGMPVSQTDYKVAVPASIVVKRNDKTYYYKRDSSILIPGVNIAYDQENHIDQHLSTFSIQKYNQLSEFVAIASDSNTIYDNAQAYTEKSDYYYDNPVNLMNTRISSKDSKGKTLTITRKFPHDFRTTAAVYDTMVNRNMIGELLEEVQSSGTTELQRNRIEYAISQPGSIIKPSRLISKILNLPDNVDMQFIKYDAKGNPQEVIGRDGITTVYLWGYNSQYPVAKVIGSNYSTVSQYVTQATIDNVAITDDQLRTAIDNVRTHLSNALVTSYTYKPVIGLTSETDPNGNVSYYEYDALGRLKLMKDKDGKIMRQYDYQYQKPVTQ